MAASPNLTFSLARPKWIGGRKRCRCRFPFQIDDEPGLCGGPPIKLYHLEKPTVQWQEMKL